MEERRKDNHALIVEMAVMANDLAYIKKTVEETKRLIEEKYVLRSEFDPVKRIVYGMVALR